MRLTALLSLSTLLIFLSCVFFSTLHTLSESCTRTRIDFPSPQDPFDPHPSPRPLATQTTQAHRSARSISRIRYIPLRIHPRLALNPISTRAVHSPPKFLPLPPNFPALPLHHLTLSSTPQPFRRFPRCEHRPLGTHPSDLPPPVYPLLTHPRSHFPAMIPAPFHPNVLTAIPLTYRHCTTPLQSSHPRNGRRRDQDWMSGARPLVQIHPGQSPGTRRRHSIPWPLTTAVRSSR